jgi:drug/metabolite transporter (DMT)-like permease
MYHAALRTKNYMRRGHLRHNADTDAESNLGTMLDITDHVASNPSNPLARYIAFASVAIIWGTTWVAIKLSLQGYPPAIGAMLRFVFGIAILGLYSRVRRLSLALPSNTMVWVAVTAMLLYVIDYGLVYWGEQYLNAGVTAILFAVVPLATTLGSAFAFRTERLRFGQLAGIVVGLLGIVAVFLDPLLATGFSVKVTRAAVAIVVAAMAAALNIVIAKRHLMLVGAVPLTLHQMLWGTLGLGIISAISGEWRHVHYSPRATLAVLYLGLAGSAAAFVMYYSLLRTMRASTLSTISYLTPLVAVFSGWMVLDESINWRVGSGVVAIFVGLATIECDGLTSILRRSFRWPLPKLQESKVQTESQA